MIHSADYTDAHRRHWSDAQLLFRHARWANADQLYGFSAECGLRAVMRALGMPVETTGMPEKFAEWFGGPRGTASCEQSIDPI